MQIVIDIDENIFTRLFDNGTEDYEIVNDDLFAIAKSIRKGTPLPKGHGRLGDLDEAFNAIKDFQNIIRNGTTLDAQKAAELVLLGRCKELIKRVDTIIEADKYIAEYTGEEKENLKSISIPFLMHREMGIPLSECQKAYDVAVEYLREKAKIKG